MSKQLKQQGNHTGSCNLRKDQTTKQWGRQGAAGPHNTEEPGTQRLLPPCGSVCCFIALCSPHSPHYGKQPEMVPGPALTVQVLCVFPAKHYREKALFAQLC